MQWMGLIMMYNNSEEDGDVAHVRKMKAMTVMMVRVTDW
jgi:hypothetical protein